MISDKILSRNDIKYLITMVGIKEIRIDEIYYDVINQLNWNIDSNTLYNYIEFIPDKLKETYIHLILYLEISNYHYNNIITTLSGIVNIFKNCHKEDYKYIDEIIENSKIECKSNVEKYKIITHIKNSIKMNKDTTSFINYLFSDKGMYDTIISFN
jgi:hypothetical protein